ncbi:MAG: toxin-antitoxin system YwqK family antitoxin, partial [Flavobacteriales bacterium]
LLAGFSLAHAQNASDAQGRKQGPWSKNWPNGQKRYAGQFKDDKPQGEFKYWTEDGLVSSIQVFAADGNTSRAQHFHPSGKVMASGNYAGQVKDSLWNYFDEEGHLRKVERLVKGALHGDEVSYYADGKEAERTGYDHGRKQGPWKQWFPDGSVKAEGVYNAGQPEGRMTWYFATGKKEIEGSTVNGEKDGTWFYWNEDGSIQLQMLFAKGEMVKIKKENGVFKEYYDDEQLKEEVTWKNGAMNGPFTEWNDNGKWVETPMAPTAEGIFAGDVQRELKGQTRKREGTYVNGKLHGTVKVYDALGKLLKTEEYADGALKTSAP